MCIPKEKFNKIPLKLFPTILSTTLSEVNFHIFGIIRMLIFLLIFFATLSSQFCLSFSFFLIIVLSISPVALSHSLFLSLSFSLFLLLGPSLFLCRLLDSLYSLSLSRSVSHSVSLTL